MKTLLIVLWESYRRRDWSGLYSIDGVPLTNSEAHTFVKKALDAGYKYDADVPDELVREWIGRLPLSNSPEPPPVSAEKIG